MWSSFLAGEREPESTDCTRPSSPLTLAFSAVIRTAVSASMSVQRQLAAPSFNAPIPRTPVPAP